MSVQLLRRLFTVQEYHKMVEAGILTADDQVELIRGEIVKMSPIGRRHSSNVKRLTELFILRLTPNVTIGVQDPVELDDSSEPQPDLSLLRRRPDFYEAGHPQPQDVFLLVEVADTTVEFDKTVKIPLYAESGILEVWLVDVSDRSVEVYRQPSPSGYGDVRRYQRGENITMLAFPDINFTLDELLG